MKEQKDQGKHQGSKSNPEKSFEAGKKGGTASTETTGQSSNVLKGSKIVGNASSAEENQTRGGKQNKPQQGKS